MKKLFMYLSLESKAISNEQMTLKFSNTLFNRMHFVGKQNFFYLIFIVVNTFACYTHNSQMHIWMNMWYNYEFNHIKCIQRSISILKSTSLSTILCFGSDIYSQCVYIYSETLKTPIRKFLIFRIYETFSN